MSLISPRTFLQNTDGASGDAFGRVRASEPYTLFDSKQIHDNQPFFWDDQEVSGSGTTSTYNSNTASSALAVGATTAGKRIRQTFQRFNYQPGKSQLVFMTGVLISSGGGTGINSRIGIFDDNNGLFFEYSEGAINIVRRTYVTGSSVDNKIPQTSWNDPLDGSGKSGMVADFTKTQIFIIDFEWLGVGRVRLGLNIDGVTYYFHELNHANTLTEVYMSTPNLPLRYEIENDGTGAASEMVHICASVNSEGGQDDNGILRYESTSGVHVDANTADTIYAIIGLRLKSTHLGTSVKLVNASLLTETNDNFEWLVIWNPTIAGTFTYADMPLSSMQSALGDSTNTITGGTTITGGFGAQNFALSSDIENALKLGVAIDGTRDEVVLCARPLSVNLDIQGSITWRELS